MTFKKCVIFKGVLVLVIYHVALVVLCAAILRLRTQERVRDPKGNTRTYLKLLSSAKQGLREQ